MFVSLRNQGGIRANFVSLCIYTMLIIQHSPMITRNSPSVIRHASFVMPGSHIAESDFAARSEQKDILDFSGTLSHSCWGYARVLFAARLSARFFRKRFRADVCGWNRDIQKKYTHKPQKADVGSGVDGLRRYVRKLALYSQILKWFADNNTMLNSICQHQVYIYIYCFPKIYYNTNDAVYLT